MTFLTMKMRPARIRTPAAHAATRFIRRLRFMLDFSLRSGSDAVFAGKLYSLKPPAEF
jgi:hypothetical protein